MARALLLALACAGAFAAAAGVRYGDYSGAKMPQYGAVDYDARAAAPPADDYRDQSPDAPAPLDYKYEEVSSDKSIPKDVEEDDSWRKPVKKLRNDKLIEHEDPEALNKYKLDEVIPKFQTKYRGKHKARYRNINKIRTEEVLSRRVSPGREEQQRLLDDEDTQIHRDFREDNSFELEDDKSKFVTRKIRPKIRRKPRDRPNVNAVLKTDEEEENMSAIRDIQKSLGGSHEYSEIEERPQENVAADIGRRFKGGVPAREEDEDEVIPIPERKLKPMKSYNDYDYYDMKRVQDIKKKIPAIQRRTQARGMAPLASRRFVAPMRTRQPFQRRKTDARTTVAPTAPSTTTTTTTTATTIRNSSDALVSIGPVTPRSHELSLAEKSRLSILKKAQRKESSLNGTPTGKPPVLLQVTQKLHTVVIVEPPEHQDPWLRAKEVSDDTPKRLEKVKRLMRRKLVANAKDIRDLTDNWNDVICDYVDVAMLDRSAAFSHTVKNGKLLLLILPAVLEFFFVIVYILKM